ncbi:tryptophan 7-halogenase [Sphingomonas sp. R86521]|uniref:tryptophan 7-halogenase n=1 Tax=Sphingomonas sp. R86521 TaxID=3093860 RepID=UPI0036D2372F
MTRTVAIVGTTLCGWMTAAALARRLPTGAYRVIVVDDSAGGDGLGDFAPVIAVPPALAGFHTDLGIDEAMLVRATGGGHALGVAFGGWRADGAAAFLSYGETGAPLQGIAFHHLAGRLRAAGQTIRLADYALSAVAAQAGRFAPDAPIAHALHLPVERYTALLRATALRLGATLADAPFADARIDGDGVVEALTLTDGSTIDPLLVLDCSGSAARIAGRTSPAFEDWSAWLPCDRVQAETVPANGSPPPYTQVDALDAGWVATWPLDGADVRLTCSRGGPGTPFRAGRRIEAWRGNCIALGAAAGVIEPLHPTALTLLLRSLAQLIQLWPADPHAPVEAAAFNRAAASAIEGARDFVVAHYAVAGRPGAFWDERRAASVPATVAAKRDLFAARGRLPMVDDEPFEEEDWAAIFDALGVIPRRHDPRADVVPLDTIERHLASHRARIIAQVRALPPYATVTA